MRMIFLILVVAGLVFFYFTRHADNPDLTGEPVTLEMTGSEVVKAHGMPEQTYRESDDREVWLYADGKLVELVDGRVIRSEPPVERSRWLRQADGRWVRSLGAAPTKTLSTGSANRATPAPQLRGNPSALDARKQWGWDPKGTALDQPARP